MPNIKLVIEYDGTNYSGWQVQPDRRTLQGTICEAIFKITGEHANLIGSGRTDAGTHAKAQVANFKIRKSLDGRSFKKALNSLLPWDIRVHGLEIVPDDFHARTEARSKIYRYQTYIGKVISPFLYRYFFHFPYEIDFKGMMQAARLLLGEHDFKGFAASSSTIKETTRTVVLSELKLVGNKMFYSIEANGFLQHMVRNIVGTLLDVGRGKMEIRAIEHILAHRDRRSAGFTAPARGLFLVKVKYGR